MAMEMKSLQYVPKKEKSLEEDHAIHGPDFPCLYVDSVQMPEIDEWEVGEEYEIKIKVKMKSYSINDEGSDRDQRSRAELSVESYERKTEKSLS